MGFSRQKYWSGLPCPPPGDLPNSEIRPRSPALQVDCLLSEPPGDPKNTGMSSPYLLQGNFPTQELNWCLLHCRRILCQLSYPGSCIYTHTYIHTHTISYSYSYILDIFYNGRDVSFCMAAVLCSREKGKASFTIGRKWQHQLCLALMNHFGYEKRAWPGWAGGDSEMSDLSIIRKKRDLEQQKRR